MLAWILSFEIVCFWTSTKLVLKGVVTNYTHNKEFKTQRIKLSKETIINN
jgi:hypothetical protein